MFKFNTIKHRYRKELFCNNLNKILCRYSVINKSNYTKLSKNENDDINSTEDPNYSSFKEDLLSMYKMDTNFKNSRIKYLNIFNDEESETFHNVIYENPILWVNILTSNLNRIIIQKDSIDSIKKILMYLPILFKESSILIYEELSSIITEFEIFMNTLSEFILNSNDSFLYLEMESFTNKYLQSFENNIFVFIFYHSFLSTKFSKIEELYLFENFKNKFINIEEINMFLYESLYNKGSIHACPRLDKYTLYLLNSFPKLFRKFSKIFNVKEVNHSKISKFMDLLIIYLYCINSKKLDHKEENLHEMLTNLDTLIDEHMKDSKNYDSAYYLLCILPNLRLRMIDSDGLIMPHTFSRLTKIFTYKDLKKNMLYTFIHVRFLKSYYRESFTSRNFNMCLVSNSFSFYYFLEQNYSEIVKKMGIKICLNGFLYLVSVKFDLSDNMINNLDSLINKIVESEDIYSMSDAILSTSLTHKPNFNVIKKILLYCIANRDSFRIRNYITIAYYSSVSLFNDTEVWDKWFDSSRNLILSRLNQFDLNMLIEMKYLLGVISPKYSLLIDQYFLSKFPNSSQLKINNSGFKRWFFSGNLENKSLPELPVDEYFRKKNINYKFQVNLTNPNFQVDFLLGDKVVIEINGPHHYYLTNLRKLNTKSRNKIKILESFGYYVFPICIIKDTDIDGWKIGEKILSLVKNSIPEEEYKKLFRNKITI